MASLRGVSANPTKQNHILGEDKVVKVAVKNDNDYIADPKAQAAIRPKHDGCSQHFTFCGPGRLHA